MTKIWWWGFGAISIVILVGLIKTEKINAETVAQKHYDVNLSFGEVLPIIDETTKNYQNRLGDYAESNFFESKKEEDDEKKDQTTLAMGLSKNRVLLGQTNQTNRNWQAESQIWINTNNGSGYTLQVGSSEVDKGSPLMATKCDEQTPCTVDEANLWVNTESEGAGFRVIGEEATSDWKTFEYFRPLADMSQQKVKSAIIAEGIQPITIDKKLDFIYQVKLDLELTSGSYTNEVNFYLVPNL